MADYWMKLYIEILDDPKMATLPDRLWRRVIEVFLVAKKLNKDGHLPETIQIAWLLRMGAEELEQDLIKISATGIIIKDKEGWFIPNFVKRQSAAPDAERKSRERERKKSQQYYGDVTEMSRNVTQRTEDREQINREQNTETEAEQNSDDVPDLFDEMRIVMSSKGIAMMGKADIDALNEIIAMGATCDDLSSGITWKVENNGGKVIRYVSQLIGPTKTAMQKRLQSSNGHTGENFKVGEGGRVLL